MPEFPRKTQRFLAAVGMNWNSSLPTATIRLRQHLLATAQFCRQIADIRDPAELAAGARILAQDLPRTLQRLTDWAGNDSPGATAFPELGREVFNLSPEELERESGKR